MRAMGASKHGNGFLRVFLVLLAIGALASCDPRAFRSFAILIQTEGEGEVWKIPDRETYRFGTEVLLEAVPNASWRFDRWLGDVTGTSNPQDIVVTSDLSITAVFVEQGVLYVINNTVDEIINVLVDGSLWTRLGVGQDHQELLDAGVHVVHAYSPNYPFPWGWGPYYIDLDSDGWSFSFIE